MEKLEPPQRLMQTWLEYFQAAQRYSTDDYSFRSCISDTLQSLLAYPEDQYRNLLFPRRENLQEYLELPEIIVQLKEVWGRDGSDEFAKSIKHQLEHFTHRSGQLVSWLLVADLINESPHNKLLLAQSGQRTIENIDFDNTSSQQTDRPIPPFAVIY